MPTTSLFTYLLRFDTNKINNNYIIEYLYGAMEILTGFELILREIILIGKAIKIHVG